MKRFTIKGGIIGSLETHICLIAHAEGWPKNSIVVTRAWVKTCATCFDKMGYIEQICMTGDICDVFTIQLVVKHISVVIVLESSWFIEHLINKMNVISFLRQKSLMLRMFQ